MIRFHTWHFSPLWALFFASPALATGGTLHPHQGLRVEVTPEGAFYRTADAPTAARPTSGYKNDLTAGLIWSFPDSGLAWIPEAVSVGNHGSEVMAEYWLNNQSAQLFSAFDTNPPTPLWTDGTLLGSTDHHTASANATNTHVGLCEFNQATPLSMAVLSKYSANSGVPDWTYTFSIPNLNGGTNVGISRNGQRIVAAVSNYNAGTVDIAVFSPASNVPLSYTTVPLLASPNSIRGFDLSADGSTLYFSAGGTPVNAYIFDVASASVVFQTPINASFDSHAISGDGSVFAFGNFNSMKVFEKVAGVYTNLFTRVVSGSNYCALIDISDDSKTIAYGFTFYNTYQTVQIEALDVPTHTVTMTDIATSGDPTRQNIVSGVSISADGQRFGVGLWGDGSGPLAEVRLYKRNQNAPIGTLNLQGSVFALAIAADGQRLAAGSKSVHANDLGSGGEIDLLGDTTPFTNYCFGDGSLVTPCPCGNSGLIGHGCQNSSTTGGALLTAAGTSSPDTVVLSSSQELPSVLTIFLQGQASAPNGIFFGDGLRCAAGILKRLYTKHASGGVAVAPAAGDPPITVQSAALGDPIMPGTSRIYQSYYRDPILSFCPSPMGDSWNASNAVKIDW